MTDFGPFRSLAAEWDRRYASAPRVFRVEPDESLVERVTPLARGRAVDLGAGEGRNSLWLARNGWDVVAVDASAVALDRLAAEATAEGLPVRIVVGDIVPFLKDDRDASEGFDLAVLAYVHPDRDDRAGILAAAAASLRPGGHFFVVGHHVASLGVAGPPDADRLYTEEHLRSVPGINVVSLALRQGNSDVTRSATDVVLWGRRTEGVRPAS